ncbi:MAG: methionine gamma-lyase family protein [Bacillota bacterium]
MGSEHWIKQSNLPPRLAAAAEEALRLTAGRWETIDQIAFANQRRVLESFQAVRLGEEDFQDSSGYGYHDRGREKLESVFAGALQGETALVRPQIVSGTHALTVALFALLRPGELLLCLTGEPYDTLQSVIGSRGEEEGSLKEWGIGYRYLPCGPNGLPEPSALDPGLEPRVVYIQRSAGYSLHRLSLTEARLEELIGQARRVYPQAWVMVDNCYGEFVEYNEPTAVGADLIVGSLIKNPGGGLAPGGGYAVGREAMIHKVAARLTAPGLYGNLGAVAGKRSLFQGLFMAPSLVSNALKNAVFAAALFELLGYTVRPRYDAPRGDIVQAIILKSPAQVTRFCRAVQAASPVEAHVSPEPGSLPGYPDPVIMAAGTFFQGASGELSADAPLRDPYAVFLQGGLTLPHALWATCRAATALFQ